MTGLALFLMITCMPEGACYVSSAVVETKECRNYIDVLDGPPRPGVKVFIHCTPLHDEKP